MHKDFLRRGYPVFWAASGVMLILSFVKRNYTYDLQLHDTYFILGFAHVAVPLMAWMTLSGIIYWLFRHAGLIGWLTVIHVLVTISLTFLVTFMAADDDMSPAGQQYISEEILRHNRLVGQFLVPGVLLWVLAQVLFFMNVTITLWSKDVERR